MRINDRGPFIKGRIIDLSGSAAKRIGIMQTGIVQVKLEAIKLLPPAFISG
ncbi:MAG: septal ring lytic transglycosylase RlpA family protein [Chlorobium sp.]